MGAGPQTIDRGAPDRPGINALLEAADVVKPKAVVLYDASDKTLLLGGGWIGSVSAV